MFNIWPLIVFPRLESADWNRPIPIGGLYVALVGTALNSPSIERLASEVLLLARAMYWPMSSAVASFMIRRCTVPSTWISYLALGKMAVLPRCHATLTLALVSSHSKVTVAGSSLRTWSSRWRTKSTGSSVGGEKSTWCLELFIIVNNCFGRQWNRLFLCWGQKVNLNCIDWSHFDRNNYFWG